MSCEAPWECLKYAFVVDENMPSLVAKKLPVFDIDSSDVAQSVHDTVDGYIMYATSEDTTAQKVATRMKVGGCYGAFSAAASMSASHDGSSAVETVRVDTCVQATKFTCHAKPGLALSPENKLNPQVVKFFKNAPVEEIAKNVGVFYATACAVGGLFQKSYVMEVSSTDSQASISAELEASYGVGFLSVSGSANCEFKMRKNKTDKRMKTTWHCEGGDATIWLGCGKDNIEGIKDRWSRSINTENLFPFNLELRPIWELIRSVDASKATAMKEYLVKLWGGDIQAAAQPESGSQGDPFQSGTCYFIKPKHSERVLDCDGDGNGKKLQLWDKISNKPNQLFKFVPAGDGYFFIEPKHTGRVLDCDGDGNGKKLQLWDKGFNQPNKLFKFVPV